MLNHSLWTLNSSIIEISHSDGLMKLLWPIHQVMAQVGLPILLSMHTTIQNLSASHWAPHKASWLLLGSAWCRGKCECGGRLKPGIRAVWAIIISREHSFIFPFSNPMLTGAHVTTPLLLLSSYNNSVQKERKEEGGRGGWWGGC